MNTAELRGALIALAIALPEGSAIPVPREALLELLGDKVRVAGPGTPADRLLDADEVARRMNVSVAWVYRQARRWPFTKRLAKKAVRFSESGLEKWLTARNSS